MTPPPATIDLAPSGLNDLFMLEALHAEPSLSQRQLAAQVGLPLSKAHFVLKRLIEKGMVKVRNVRDSKHKLGYLTEQRSVTPNLELLANALEQTGHDPTLAARWRAAIGERCLSLDWAAVRRDVAPFVERQSDLDQMTPELIGRLVG